jgi:hypothetical protein
MRENSTGWRKRGSGISARSMRREGRARHGWSGIPRAVGLRTRSRSPMAVLGMPASLKSSFHKSPSDPSTLCCDKCPKRCHPGRVR